MARPPLFKISQADWKRAEFNALLLCCIVPLCTPFHEYVNVSKRGGADSQPAAASQAASARERALLLPSCGANHGRSHKRPPGIPHFL